MARSVVFTDDALADLENLCSYIAERDSDSNAQSVLDRIERALMNLAELPERGRHPPELAALGIRVYREIFFKPYRLIYRVEQRRVVVLLIADGRRDMQSLLARRLLSPSGRSRS